MKESIQKLLWRGVLAAIVFFFAIMLTKSNTKLQNKISILLYKNQQLEDSNKSLESQREALRDSVKNADVRISYLESQEGSLKKQNQDLQNSIKLTRKKYEKADTHTINYNADSITRYFSELQ
jgi:predicted nuclease with TOPRIM domain